MKKNILTLFFSISIVFSYAETPLEKIIQRCSTFEIPLSFDGTSITISFSEKDLIKASDANSLFTSKWEGSIPIFDGPGPRYIFFDGSMQKCMNVEYISPKIKYVHERERTVFAKYKEYENFYLILIAVEIQASILIDLYSFSKSGEIISSIPILQADNIYYFPEYGICKLTEAFPVKEEGYPIIISSKAYDDKFVTTEIQDVMKMRMTYQLLDDGYFKLINRELECDDFKDGYIDDSDGYVNVRKEPNAKSSVLFTLKDKIKVVYYPVEDSNWAIIVSYIDENGIKINCNGGYVHNSRIREKK